MANITATNSDGNERRTYGVPNVAASEAEVLRRNVEEVSDVIRASCTMQGDGSVRLEVRARVAGQALDALLLPVFRTTLGRSDCTIVPR